MRRTTKAAVICFSWRSSNIYTCTYTFQDPYWHTAWYYVCFSKDLSRTQKVELGRLLLQHRGDELCTPEGLLMVAYTDLYEVGVPLLDLLQYEILSKCANLTKVVSPDPPTPRALL